MRTRRSTVALLLLFSYLTVQVTGLQAEPAQRNLRLGAPLAFSGIGAEHAENMRKGIELAKSVLEKDGWNVKCQFEDTTAEAVRVVSTVRSLTARGYRLLIGPTWSYMVAAAKPILESSNSIAFSPATSTEITEGPSPNLFHGVPKHGGKIEPTKRWLKENRVKRAAIIISESGWGNLH